MVDTYADPDSGGTLQVTYRVTTTDRFTTELSMIVLADDRVAADPALFSPDGYPLLYSSDPQGDGSQVRLEPTAPTVAVAPLSDHYRPVDRRPEPPEKTSRRFATEVLGWHQPLVTLVDRREGLAELDVADRRGHHVGLIFDGSDAEGWQLFATRQDPADRTGVHEPDTSVLYLNRPPGTAAVTIDGTTVSGQRVAWRGPVGPITKWFELAVNHDDPAHVLVVFRDAAGTAIGAIAVEEIFG